MATTIADIIGAAVADSVANQGLANDVPDLITRINTYQRKRWTQFCATNKFFYQITDTVVSTTGNGNRSADLATLSLPVERILTVHLPSGTEVREVVLQDTDAELAPRYYQSGMVVREVGTDWNSVNTSAVTLTIGYCYRPVDLDPSGTTDQPISIPDGYANILSDELGAYFSTQDVGRPDSETARLLAQAEASTQAWIQHAANVVGVPAYRFGFSPPNAGETA